MMITQFDKGWILGFIEGEGCFTRQIVGGRPPERDGVPTYLPSFTLVQVNEEPLKFVKRFFVGGHIYARNHEGKKYWSIKKSTRYDYCVRDRKTLEKLRVFCDGKLKHPGKIMDFEKWRGLFNNYVGVDGQKEIAREEMVKRWSDPGWRNKMKESHKKRWTPENREKQKERLKKRWKNLKKRGFSKLVSKGS